MVSANQFQCRLINVHNISSNFTTICIDIVMGMNNCSLVCDITLIRDLLSIEVNLIKLFNKPEMACLLAINRRINIERS